MQQWYQSGQATCDSLIPEDRFLAIHLSRASQSQKFSVSHTAARFWNAFSSLYRIVDSSGIFSVHYESPMKHAKNLPLHFEKGRCPPNGLSPNIFTTLEIAFRFCDSSLSFIFLFTSPSAFLLPCPFEKLLQKDNFANALPAFVFEQSKCSQARAKLFGGLDTALLTDATRSAHNLAKLSRCNT